MSAFLKDTWLLALFGIIGIAIVVVTEFTYRSDDKTREIEMEWRIPSALPNQVPTDIGMVSLSDSIESGPVTDHNTKRDDRFVILSRAALIPPHARTIFPCVQFRREASRLAAWAPEIPRRGLAEQWSDWQRAKFIDDSDNAEFKLLYGEADSRRDPPMDLEIEMRFKIPSYFTVD